MHTDITEIKKNWIVQKNKNQNFELAVECTPLKASHYSGKQKGKLLNKIEYFNFSCTFSNISRVTSCK